MSKNKTNKSAKDTKNASDPATVAANIDAGEVIDLNKDEHTSTKPAVVSTDNGTHSFARTEVTKVTNPKFVQGTPKMDNVHTQVHIDNIETPTVTREIRTIDERLKKADYQRLIDELDETTDNYDDKKADLEKQLNNSKE